MANKIQIRRDTTANWTASNPILSQGELGLDTTLNKIKIGNGTAQWSALSFYTGNPSSLINGLHTVSLNSSGVVTFPGNIATDGNQLTGWSGNLDLNIDGSIQLSADANCALTLQANSHQWAFGTDGALTLPNSGEIFDYAGGAGVLGILISRTFQTPNNANSANFGTNTIKLVLSDVEAEEIREYILAGIGVRVWFNQGDSYPITSCVQVSTGVWTITALNMGNRFTTFAASNTLIFIYTGSTPNTYTNFEEYAPAGAGAAVTIFKGGNNWYFTAEGDLSLPPSGTIRNSMTGDNLLNPTKLINGSHQVVLNVTGTSPYVTFPAVSGSNVYIQGSEIVADGIDFASALSLTSLESYVKLSANAATSGLRRDWIFGTNGNLTLPKGGSVSETSNTIAFAPPTAAVGQSLVIRPTAGQFTISTDHTSGFVPGESITITVSTQFGSDSGELYYTITGATTEQLGRATTGTLTFSSESTKAVTWTIPVQSSMTTFTFDLTGGTGFPGPGGIYVEQLPEITVTLDGSANSEFSHVHLVAGNPTTVDMYLGDDDQYVKIEKNAGNVVVGTNLNTHQWTFGTNSNLTLPNASTISPVSQVGYSYGPYASDIYNNTTGGALSSGTQTVINIGDTVHNNLFDPPVATATTTTGTIASNGDFEPGTSTGTFDLHTDIIVSGQSLGDLQYRDDANPEAGFTLAHPVTPYTGPVVTAGTLISGYSGWITRTPKTTTYIRWADGSRSQVTGSSVNLYPNSPNSGLITTDNVSGKSFPATLYTANYIPSGTAIGVNGNDWKFGTDGKLKLPGTAYNNTSPNYIHANNGILLHPTHNTGGTGPELYISYNDGIVIQPITNDYFQSGTAAAPLFITGSNLPNTNDSIGKLPGDIYINGGRNVKDNTYGKVIVNSGITSQWQFNSSGQLTFPDTTIQHTAYREPDVTNQFYVDPFAANTYTPTGSILKPFRTIAAAQAEIEARITANTLVPGELNPIFIVLTGSITENVTLTRGHVFLTTLNGSIHTPIYLTGQITINGDNSSTGAIDANHFAITGLTIVGPNQGACIYFTGTNAQRLQVQDIWLTARGSQTGTTPFVNAGGYGIFSDNSGVRASDNKRSPIHGSDVKISHTGSGDVYCFRFSNGSTGEFDNVETSGATQVGAAGSGSLLAFTNSTLDANGEVILEAYGTGSISVNNCLLSNSNTGVSYGIWLHDLGGNAIIINTVISVASSNAASRMIKGNATDPTGVFYNNIMVGKSTTYPYPDLNKKVDNTVVLTALTGAAGLTAVNP
jgi:hypothetical protein